MGHFTVWVAGGDTGVRSIQSFQINTTAWTSGTIHLVAYRIIDAIEISVAGISESRNIINGGLKRCWNGTIPYVMFVPGTTSTQLFYNVMFAQNNDNNIISRYRPWNGSKLIPNKTYFLVNGSLTRPQNLLYFGGGLPGNASVNSMGYPARL